MAIARDSRLKFFHEHGYFVVPAFMPPTELGELRRACDMALDRARGASLEKGHTTAKIGLLADPSYFAHDRGALDRIAAFFGSAKVCALLDGLAHPSEDGPPRIKSADYYHEQTRRDWDGDWHRDSQFGQPDPEIERRLVLTTTSVHVRVALETDDRLEIVPGSHRRWDTPDELRIRKGENRAIAAMPEAMRMTLRPGDACIFHAWSIHRATYRRAPVRRTVDALYAFGRPPVGRLAI
jgi:hypothetical protein